MKKMIFTLLLCLGGSVSGWAQGSLSSPILSEDFGSLANATTLTTSNTAFSWVRVGTSTTSNSIVNEIIAKNPGSFTASSALIGAKGTSVTTVDKTGLTSFSSGTFTLKFKTPSSLTSAIMVSAVGTGSSFGSSNGFTGAQLSSAFQVAGTNLQIRATGAWTTVQTVAVSTTYTVTIVFNNTAGSLTYGDSKTLPSNKCHVWVNGAYVNEYAAATASLAASAFRIYTTTAEFEVDDIAVYNTFPSSSTPAPVVTAGSPTGTVGVSFNYQIVASNSPTSYAVSSGTLPNGLTLNTTTGEITGTPTTAGTPSVSVTATNAGGTSDPATLSFTIAAGSKTAQTITFGALDSKTYGAATFDLTGSASSTLAVSYTSSNEAVATVSGATVTIVGAGSTDITASQAGDATYDPAPSVMHSLAVTGKELTLPDAVVTPKTYTGTNAAVITGTLTGIINADAVTLVGAGLFADVNVGTGIAVTSNASLAGAKAGNYILTQPTGLLGDITKASQTITFGALASKVASDAAFTLSATSSSTLTVAYASSNEAVATVSGNTVTLVAGGTTTITATQVGNGNYEAAVAVPQTLSVNYAAPVASAATRQTGSSMFANWAVVPGATGYLVDVYKKSAGGGLCTDLIISEYVEGTSNNKAIEIYNGTGATVDLSTYSIKKQTNGAGVYTSEQVLTGSLVNGEVFIMANTSSNATILAVADVTNNSTASFNGNDAVGLFKAGVLIDEVGVFDQTTDWGKDVTLIRKSTITSPKPTYDAADWNSNATDYITDLGVHTLNAFVTSPIAGSPFPAMGGAVDSLYITGLSYDTYYYTVKATDGVMTSAASNEITFVIDATTNIVTPSADRMYVASGRLFVTGSQAYSVYNTQGVQVASVSANSASSSIALRPGIYVVKTTNRVQKVVVR